MRTQKGDLKVPDYIKKIILHLKEFGKETYLAGGTVRDLYLNREPEKWEVSTEALPEEIPKFLFQRGLECQVSERGLGSFTIRKSGIWVEISSFRSNDEGGDKVGNFVSGTLEEDAKRRDFSCNCVYYDPILEQFWDPTENGLNSLENRDFFFINDDDDAIDKDPLRILRAVSLCLTKEMRPLALTASMRKNAHKLKRVPRERISKELISWISQIDSPETLFVLLEKWGIKEIVFKPYLAEIMKPPPKNFILLERERKHPEVFWSLFFIHQSFGHRINKIAPFIESFMLDKERAKVVDLFVRFLQSYYYMKLNRSQGDAYRVKKEFLLRKVSPETLRCFAACVSRIYPDEIHKDLSKYAEEFIKWKFYGDGLDSKLEKLKGPERSRAIGLNEEDIVNFPFTLNDL